MARQSSHHNRQDFIYWPIGEGGDSWVAAEVCCPNSAYLELPCIHPVCKPQTVSHPFDSEPVRLWFEPGQQPCTETPSPWRLSGMIACLRELLCRDNFDCLPEDWWHMPPDCAFKTSRRTKKKGKVEFLVKQWKPSWYFRDIQGKQKIFKLVQQWVPLLIWLLWSSHCIRLWPCVYMTFRIP